MKVLSAHLVLTGAVEDVHKTSPALVQVDHLMINRQLSLSVDVGGEFQQMLMHIH